MNCLRSFYIICRKSRLKRALIIVSIPGSVGQSQDNTMEFSAEHENAITVWYKFSFSFR